MGSLLLECAIIVALSVQNQNDWHTVLLGVEMYANLSEDTQTAMAHRLISIVMACLMLTEPYIRISTESWRAYAQQVAVMMSFVGILALLGVRVEYLTGGLFKTMIIHLWSARRFNYTGREVSLDLYFWF